MHYLFMFAVIGAGLQKKFQSQGVISEAAVRDGGILWPSTYLNLEMTYSLHIGTRRRF
jgi:hypothetical protein